MFMINKLLKQLPATVPFVGPEAIVRQTGADFVARLGANESVFGPSPKVYDALKQAPDEIYKYPDPEAWDLREALSKHIDVPMDAISIGEGIDGLLGVVARAVMEPRDIAVTTAGSYPTFNYHVAGFGCRLEVVPMRNDREDLVALVERARAVGARLLYVSNPNNPMGTVNSVEKIKSAISALPDGCMMILDEAYLELADHAVNPAIDLSRRNVLHMRTFSKAYGMAGQRVGYVIGAPEFVQSLNKIRNHFGVNRLGQMAALAALKDQDYLQWVLARTKAGRVRLAKIAEAKGLAPIESHTNFVTMDCGTVDRANAILNALIARRIFVRKPMVAPQDRCIRVSVSVPKDIDRFETALREVLQTL
ncbi:MAG: aminotransferase class I/II-fold pyridoxal phosphate-dependent enzyme [Pseudomonadota bacterium]